MVFEESCFVSNFIFISFSQKQYNISLVEVQTTCKKIKKKNGHYWINGDYFITKNVLQWFRQWVAAILGSSAIKAIQNKFLKSCTQLICHWYTE